jgi:hypothetical protein
MMSKKSFTYNGKKYRTEKKMLIDFLDFYQATEKFASQWFARWLKVTKNAYMRGGLATIMQREKFHGKILEQRLKNLGGTPQQTIPAKVRKEDFAFYASARSDQEKLDKAVGWIKDPVQALAIITDIHDQLSNDQETKQLLYTVLQDEAATLEWLREANKKFGGVLA